MLSVSTPWGGVTLRLSAGVRFTDGDRRRLGLDLRGLGLLFLRGAEPVLCGLGLLLLLGAGLVLRGLGLLLLRGAGLVLRGLGLPLWVTGLDLCGAGLFLRGPVLALRGAGLVLRRAGLVLRVVGAGLVMRPGDRRRGWSRRVGRGGSELWLGSVAGLRIFFTM